MVPADDSPSYEALRAFLHERRPSAPGLAGLRRSLDRTCEAMPPNDGAASVMVHVGNLPLHRFDAGGAPGAGAGTILYLHGGGYLAGSAISHGRFAAAVARACGAGLYLPEYRLAPEHPFPAALEDALAVYRYLLDEGIPPSAIMLAGDSAGGGLALAAAMELREAGIAGPAGLWLLSPWTDLRPRRRIDRGDPVLRPRDLDSAGPLYAGQAAPDCPRMSPLLGDLAALPPMLVQAGEIEILCDEARALAAAVNKAGGEATLQVAAGMVHVWPIFSAFFPAQSRRAIDDVADFFRRRTGCTRPSAQRKDDVPR